jgi:hypothetical protein
VTDPETDVDDSPDFVSVAAVAGHGRLWLFDATSAVLVAVDPNTVEAKVHASLPPVAQPPSTAAPDPWHEISHDAAASASLQVTHDAVWVVRPPELVLVDPWGATSARPSIAVPPGASAWATDGDTFWATAWPSGDVLAVDTRTGAQRQVTVGGHLSEICVSGGTVWVVDRTDETLLGLDSSTLQPRIRVPFDGGRVGPLLGWRGGVLARRTEDDPDQEPASLSWVKYDGTRQQLLRSGADGVLALDGDALWCATTREAPVMDRTDILRLGAGLSRGRPRGPDWPDPLTTLRELLLPQAEPGRTVTLPGQLFHLAALDDCLWAQVFLRSRDAFVVTAIDPDGVVVGDVDLPLPYPVGLPHGDNDPAGQQDDLETPDETLDRLPGAVRQALTTPGFSVDDRTGERTPTPPVDRRFTVVDVTLEPETYDVWVIFTWNDDPGRRFGYVYTADPETPAAVTAADLRDELDEDLSDGIMDWGERDTVDGVIWVSRPPDHS